MKLSNAAGIWCKTPSNIETLCQYPLDAITLGTITTKPRLPQSEIFFDGKNSWNALGLPNEGIDYYRTHTSSIRETIDRFKKELRISIFGESPADWHDLLSYAVDVGATTVELNISCPNLHHRPLVENIPELTDILNLTTTYADKIKIAVKMPAFCDNKKAYADLFEKSKISEVVAINSIATAHLPKNPHPPLASGGAQIHHIAIEECTEWRNVLPTNIELTGVGGIHSKETVEDFVNTGVQNIQIGSMFLSKNIDLIKKLLNEVYLTLDTPSV